MEKICRSVTTLYRLPRISNLNLRLNSTSPTTNAATNCCYIQCKTSSSTNNNNNNYYYYYNHNIKPLQHSSVRHYSSQKPPGLNNKIYSNRKEPTDGSTDQSLSLADILEREIQDETAELSQHLSTDQFPGFSVETDDSDVKLSKQVNGATVNVRFTVSSSLSEWPTENHDPQAAQGGQQQEDDNMSTQLVSMPEFQVQIIKNNNTLELSCYFEELETDEETGVTYPDRPIFGIEELVMYEGEPKETEFAVSAEYFQEDLQEGLLKYMANHGIDDDFAQNLVSFATSYEKKQYIGLMNRLKNFVSK